MKVMWFKCVDLQNKVIDKISRDYAFEVWERVALAPVVVTLAISLGFILSLLVMVVAYRHGV